QSPTVPAVTRFAPGVIPATVPNCTGPAFLPNGRTVIFTAAPPDFSSDGLYISQQRNGKWTTPMPAPFSGHFRNLEAAMAPSGKFLIFASNRPSQAGGPTLTGHYNGKALPDHGGHLWRVARSGSGWDQVVELPDSINSTDSVFSPAVTGDGSLYFMHAVEGGDFHIYRSALAHGVYQTPKPAAFSQTKYPDFDPAVAADESYVIFSSPRPPAPPHTSDLFIVFRTSKGWSAPLDLRDAISPQVYGIEARLSPAGRTLYFTHSAPDKTNPIWQVSLASVLAHRPQ
ncbi:MAG: hypothetical protein ACRD2D_02120, partial [Terriglobales bacterium]